MKSNTQMGYGALAIAGLCLLLGSVANAAPTGKIEICHKHGERNQRILSINEEKDGAKHIGHGDYVIAPEMCDAIDDNDCDGVDGADVGLDDADCEETTPGATCVADECVAPPVECPCDYQAALAAFTANGGEVIAHNTHCGDIFGDRISSTWTKPTNNTMTEINAEDDASDGTGDPVAACTAVTSPSIPDTVSYPVQFERDLTPGELRACRAAVPSFCNGT